MRLALALAAFLRNTNVFGLFDMASFDAVMVSVVMMAVMIVIIIVVRMSSSLELIENGFQITRSNDQLFLWFLNNRLLTVITILRFTLRNRTNNLSLVFSLI